jgi:hypothetical protein
MVLCKKMVRTMRNLVCSIFGLLIIGFSVNCNAFTECTATIGRIYTGDDGYIWMVLDNGMLAYVIPTDPDTKNILAIATTALVTEKTVTIRLNADGIACNGSAGVRSDVAGLWLWK